MKIIQIVRLFISANPLIFDETSIIEIRRKDKACSLPKMISLITVLVIFLTGSTAHAQLLETRIPHQKSQYDRMSYDNDFVRVVLKFHDGSGVRARKGQLAARSEHQDQRKLRRRGLNRATISRDVKTINGFLKQRALSVEALIDAREEELKLSTTIAEKYWRQELAELPTYLQIVLKDGGRDPELRNWVRFLKRFDVVEVVYAEPVAVPFGDKLAAPPVPWGSCAAEPLDPLAGDLSVFQGYLHTPPAGIDVAAAHSTPGGKGEGIRVIDIEGGYIPHSDHKSLFQIVGHTVVYEFNAINHGNAVVGIISSQDNGIGVTGIAPNASIGFRSIYNSNLFDDWSEANMSSANVANNIYWAAKHSMQGVALIELQRPGPADPDCLCETSCIETPVEYWAAEFDVIQNAVGNGAVIVEAAANGGRDLDHSVFDTCGGGCFDRDIRDSGAILVSGSFSDGVTPQCDGNPSSNYGSRIDVHSWSKNVATTSGADSLPSLYDGDGHCNDYRDDFNGTSSASAIVAGAAAALQGVQLANNGAKLDPLSLRQIMTDTGTPQAAGTEDIWIGPQPDLGAAISEILGGT